MYDQMAEIVEKQGVAALADLMAHTPILPACQILAFLCGRSRTGLFAVVRDDKRLERRL